MKKSTRGFWVIAVLAMFGAFGCSKKGQESAAQTAKVLVCDPFNGKGSATANNGIIGDIYQLTPELVTAYNTVAELEAHGTLANATLVLSSINVPTINFASGFPTADGSVIRLPGGAVLTEYFALHLEGTFKLPAGAQTGYYQFGLMADDGALLQVDDGSGYRVVVNSDGVHKSEFDVGTADQVVLFDTADKQVPFKLDYFQGPRFNMALTALFRNINDGSTVPVQADLDQPTLKIGPANADNGTFFDTSTTPSTPTQAWLDIVDPGNGNWSIIPAESYLLPAGVTSNPCVK